MLIPQEIIRKKRDGFSLTKTEIESFFMGMLKGDVADYQGSAMAMAIFFRGLNQEETVALTQVMLHSGERLAPWNTKLSVIDKHSTGGVGDKTSIVLLPLCASMDILVPMMAGRGLGHSGGTLDKLESIPGFSVFLSKSQIVKQLHRLGGVFMGQTENLVPLDRKLYGLRDVTATVESIPLITASILSKKLCEGLTGLVMDVKFGSGAFMQQEKDAEALAQSISSVGRGCGLAVTTLLTSMNSPLGPNSGNILEILECIDILKGEGPAVTKELILALGLEMARLAFPKEDSEHLKMQLEKTLASGVAFERFLKIVEAQGGDPSFIENPKKFKAAKTVVPVLSGANGFVESIDVRTLGVLIVEMGGGRTKTSDKIDPSVGFSGCKRIGDAVSRGDPLVFIHGPSKEIVDDLKGRVLSCFRIGPNPVKDPLILKTL